MTSRKKVSPAGSAADAKMQELGHRISEAQKEADQLRSKAKAAKAESKKARKLYKQTKKAAKEARKKVKALKQELHDMTAAAAKATRRVTVQPVKPRKPSRPLPTLTSEPAATSDVPSPADKPAMVGPTTVASDEPRVSPPIPPPN